MPVNAPSLKPTATPTFNNSLTRTIIVTLLVVTMLPMALLSIVTFIRNRSMLQTMVSEQLETMVEAYSKQIEDLVISRQGFLEETSLDPSIRFYSAVLLNPESSDDEIQDANYWLLESFNRVVNTPGGGTFDQMALVDQDGTVKLATNAAWTGLELVESPVYSQINHRTTSLMAYDFWPLYPRELTIITAYAFTDSSTGLEGTIVGIVVSPLPTSLLVSAEQFFPQANAYLYTFDNQLVSSNSDQKLEAIQSIDAAYTRQLGELRTSGSPTGLTLQSETEANLAYAHWMPALRASLVTTVPEEVAYSKVRTLIPLTIAMLIISAIITGGLLFVATARMVNPLVQLSKKARNFARGDFNERAEVNRSDEIGMLAYSFNHMVQELSTLYRSLEGKVEERTRQLRTAADVAAVVTSTTEQQEMLRRTVELITERFGYHYAAIYLLDESGNYAVLQEVASVTEESHRLKGQRVPVSTQNAIGRVASSNEPFVSADSTVEPAQGRTLLARTRSQVILPIAIGSQVFGVLDVQSPEINAFDPETVVVMGALGSQIATGLRNLLLLASTQVNLEESGLIARASRQVTLSQTKEEAISVISAVLAQTPYVATLLSVESDHLKMITLHDPKGSSIDATIKGISIPLQKGAARLTEGGMIIASDLKAPIEFENLFSLMARRDCQSGALIPILNAGQPALVICLGSRDRRPLTQASLQSYSNLAEITGNTIERFEALQMLQKRLIELETLKRVGETITAEINLESLFEVLHQQVLEQMGADLSFGIAIYRPETSEVEIPFMSNGTERLHLDSFQLGEGLTSVVITERRPLLLNKNTERAAFELGARIVGKPARSWMGVPLLAGGEVLGAMVLQDTDHEERFSQDDLNLFNTLAPQVANIIRNTRLLNEMQQAVQAYEQEHFLLNTLLANIPEQVYFKDQDGEYIRASESFAQGAGIENSIDLVGKTDLDLFGVNPGSELYETDQHILNEGEPLIGEVSRIDTAVGEAWKLISKIPLTSENGDRIGLLGLSQDITELKRVEQMTLQRAQQLQTAAEVARETINTLHLDEILHKAVELIRERFGFYHASIFLVDRLGEYAILRESSGEIGARMKEIGHRLAVGPNSLVGQTTSIGQSVVVNNVRSDPNYYANPLTPDTNSEAVIPLKAGDQILGALDVQSVELEAFTPDAIHTLEILADQLAVAVVNANLFARTEDHLAKHRLLHHITSAATASDNLSSSLRVIVDGLSTALPGSQIAVLFKNNRDSLDVFAAAGYDQDLSHLQVKMGEGAIGIAASERRPVRINDTLDESNYAGLTETVRSAIAVPILFVDDLIGVLNIESDQPAAFDENDQEILGTLGDNIGAIISNARLIEQVRLQTDRQKRLFDITNRIRRSVDMDSILKTSATELARVLNAQRTKIEILSHVQPETPNASSLDTKVESAGNNGHGRSNGKESSV